MVVLTNGIARDGQELFASLFHGMITELKSSTPAWDNVCSRANKLVSQLQNTANALGHFVDALQTVSDSANNVNGISRDIGAALTRLCIRQHAIETALRSLAQTLQSQFVVDLERKCVEWRHLITDVERRHQRTSKRLKARQQQMEVESRNAYVELLHMQRSQFTGFTSALLPVINTQLALLDEGTHVHQVRGSMELAINENDAPSLVQALIEDKIACCSVANCGKISTNKSNNTKTEDEHRAWDQRVGLGLASARAKSASQLRICPSTSGSNEAQPKSQQLIDDNNLPQYSGSLPDTSGVSSISTINTIGNVNNLRQNQHRVSMPPSSIVYCASNCNSIGQVFGLQN